MRFLPLLLVLITFESLAFESSRFGKKEPLPQAIMGVSTYVGGLKNEANEQALYVGGSLYVYFFNWALEARAFPDGTFERDNLLQPYMGVGLGRLLQFQRGVDFTSTTRVRIVSEIAFDEFVDTRNHWTLQGFAEQIHTSGENKRRYGLALGYTF